ncbi:carboxymuconolactone decarboxylase family protein [Bdellovibrio sp. ZAP7]|uniref:carboxymuconolactone decarboxylase family protein n=1 Tax=Bdellovibrio sp. ZAP7 TaxID=2231053 RepID=UPI001159328F|nr:carboxymuconolactone decarboxylase family protein [Bdellovibrio sp. ZAP7]QDK45210.1 carboxymuconolactone decarboxylase family protein [Bdellovibrio sp. ZAP7]
MSQRVNYNQQSPEIVHSLMEISKQLSKSEISQTLRDMVNIRASQINGCAFCIDMHVKEARIHGERDLRVHHVQVWRESTLFNAQERAALEWTEAVTKLTAEGISDEIYNRVKEHFSEKQMSDLTLAIGLINQWNRLSIAFRAVPGSADKFFGLDKAGMN